MGTPHKHAEVIKAWADGAVVEARDTLNIYPESRKWHVVKYPAFSSTWEYRVKPPKKWYRVALLKTGHTITADFAEQEVRCSRYDNFVKWLTDRIEYE